MAGKDWARAHLFKGGGVTEASVDLRSWLAALVLGPATRVGALDLWPLLHRFAAQDADLLAPEAIAAGLLDVREKDGGVVQELIATSRAARPIILFQGEVLLGARQNRMVAHTVVIAPAATVVVSVGCVERGRWQWTAPGFSGAGYVAESRLRRSAQASVAAARPMSGGVRLSQAHLWSEVDLVMEMDGVRSPTSDYDALRRRREAEERTFARVTPVDGQVGMMALRDGALVGLDLVGSIGTWRGVAGRILRSLLPESRPSARRPSAPGRLPSQWLAALRDAHVDRHRAQGTGEDIALGGPGLTGAGVWLDGRPAHVSAFGRLDA
jgi:hypothetical protein